MDKGKFEMDASCKSGLVIFCDAWQVAVFVAVNKEGYIRH
jgi:hypothetical protein